MCTVSWMHEDAGYQIFCNRDLHVTRRPAAEPRVLCRDGVCFLAPIDGDAGGTWIATNEFGVTVCLLDGVGESEPRSSVRHCSAGVMVLRLASAESIQDVQVRVWQSPLMDYEPFTLVVLEPGLPTMVIEWDGAVKRILPYSEPDMPLVSSSFKSAAVRDKRRSELARLAGGARVSNPVSLLMFHQSHLPERGPYSPCMHRHDAETASFSWISVTDWEASFYYSAGAPCQALTGFSYTLALRKEETAPRNTTRGHLISEVSG
jgi:hypothetical protein